MERTQGKVTTGKKTNPNNCPHPPQRTNCMRSAAHFYHCEITFNLRRNLCATFAETHMSKYLCADVQLLQFHASLSKIKVLSTL